MSKHNKYLGKTKKGFDVYVDMGSSHASTHFQHNPNLFDFVRKAIGGVEENDDHIRVEKNMGEIVGTTDLVETDEQSEIIYAKRPLRKNHSRFYKKYEANTYKLDNTRSKKI